MNINKFFRGIATMLKIGSIGFGGGTALIPVMEEELVEKQKLVSEEDFNGSMMIATITPGALPVEIATGIGYRLHGESGMIAAATAMALPGSFFMILFMILMNYVGNHVKVQIHYISVGITAFIIAMLLQYIYHTVCHVEQEEHMHQYLFIMISVIVLTAEEYIYKLFHVEAKAVFGMSTIEILILSFFIIFYTKGNIHNVSRWIPTGIVSVLYILCTSNLHWIPEDYHKLLNGTMFLMAAYGLIQSIKESPYRKKVDYSRLCKIILSWGIFLGILSIPAFMITRDLIRFLTNGMISSVMSFGGGDAYLSIAQGIFVDGGFVDYHEFYGNIVSIANILPGSILCKVLCGVAYIWGYSLHQSQVEAFFMAISGFACSVTASGLIFMSVYFLYETYQKIRIIKMIKQYIRPIISGLLINVMFSLYFSLIELPASVGDAKAYIPWILLGILFLNLFMNRNSSIHFLPKVLLSTGVSCMICNMMA